jgi:hypothetical protein
MGFRTLLHGWLLWLFFVKGSGTLGLLSLLFLKQSDALLQARRLRLVLGPIVVS